MIPPLDSNPVDGLKPTKLVALAGLRTELTVSVPIPPAAKFAATAVPVPPEDSPGVLVKSYGFRV